VGERRSAAGPVAAGRNSTAAAGADRRRIVADAEVRRTRAADCTASELGVHGGPAMVWARRS
jgi:hypothetical protein